MLLPYLARTEDLGIPSEASEFGIAQNFLNGGLNKAHPMEKRSGGLAAVGEGIDDVREGKVKGKKLVYTVKKGI